MTLNKVSRHGLASLLFLAYLGGAQAGVYKCTDAKGHVFYRDTPCQELTTAKLPSHLSQLGSQDQTRLFMWKASSQKPGKGAAYLLGSMHFGSSEILPLPARIMDAYNASDVLVVEANVENSGTGEAARKLAEAGTYHDGSTLENHVKPATWQKTLEAAKRLSLTEDALKPQKPWMAALSLTATALKSAGYDQSMGIDQTMIKENGIKKPMLEIESVDQQIKLFDQFSPQEQEQMLLQSLQDLNRGPDQFKQIIDAWKNGDVEAMDIIVRQSFDAGATSSKLYQVLFSDRNTAMTNKIDELLDDGRTYFIVIGAGHLGGEQGVLKQLEAKGYTLTQS